MKKISVIALAGALAVAGFALPAFAAPSTGALSAGQVPSCSSSTAQRGLKDGNYASDFQKQGLSIDSLEIWNGCVKVLYSDGTGNSGMAIYDPDTLQLLQSSGTVSPPVS